MLLRNKIIEYKIICNYFKWLRFYFLFIFVFYIYLLNEIILAFDFIITI